MLIIRLKRIGKKNRPFFRIVLIPHTKASRGAEKEILGFYDPLKKEKSFKKERIQYWLSRGVKTSATAHNLLVHAGIISGAKRKAHASPKKKEEEKVVLSKETKGAQPESRG